MLVLYRSPDCTVCDEIESKLQELVLAYRVVDVNKNGSSTFGKEENRVPVLEEGGRTFDSPDEIRNHLKQIETEILFSRQISGDACYVNPDNPGECI